MTIAARKFTFPEYLTCDDGTNHRYELVDGELVHVGIGTGLHGAIAEFLSEQFKAGRYDDTVFTGAMAIASATFPTLSLTAAQILAGRI